MNEDELIESLRRTLQSRAAAVKPSKRPLPHAPEIAPRPKRRVWLGVDRPWALVGAGIIAAGAAAAISVAVSLTGTGHKVSVTPGTKPPVTVSPPTTLNPVPTSLPAHTTTLPPALPVPSGFRPVSATFVSADSGWVLGQAPCGSSSCASLARTSNGGQTWSAASAPPLNFANGTPTTGTWVRFYNLQYGWIVFGSEGGQGPSQLWYTQDGGNSWQAAPLPGGGQVLALEASRGVVHLVEIPNGVVKEMIYTSPIDHLDWQPSSTALKIGGGPVPTAQVTLFDHSGWIIGDDRTTIDGAELIQGQWNSWAPPCLRSNGSGLMAAASATDLVAACNEGTWGPSGDGLNGPWVFTSTDGGTSFSKVAPLPSGTQFTSITAAPGHPQTVVVGSSGGLLASFDDGQTWQAEYTTANLHGITFVGFTTASQAVAVDSAYDGTSSSLLMTYDGGHTWSTVKF